MAASQDKKRFCINCDNKHGCKSGTPPCIAEMEKDRVTGINGKQYLMKIKKIYRCEHCPFFRSCWNIEDYRKISR
ncbi:MAG TPA: hypothetical protein PKW07_02510 [Syntrophorhabdaceae bacterium]|nr:hypothetical protein [Syntrophorhabdaceae bacterium]